MNRSTNNPIRFWSKVSGISLLIMALAAGVGYGYAINQLYVEGNAVQTLANIEANTPIFLTAIVAWLVILITDLLVSYGFYRFLKPVNKQWALSSGILRLVYSIMLFAAILFLMGKNIDAFMKVWSMGLIIFGFHLTATGVGSMYSKQVPKILSILLIIAGLSYSLISGMENLLPHQKNLVATLEAWLVVPMTLGELLFAFWLLIRGGRVNPQPSDEPVQDVL